MKLLTLRLLFLLSMQFSSVLLLAQKDYKLTVNLPPAINPEKMEVWLDNGKEAREVNPQPLTGKQMVLTGEYYSIYAVITLHYPPNDSVKGFTRNFFVGEKPGVIAFKMSGSMDSPFANYSLRNVLDFEKEKKEMDDYSAEEGKKAMDYENQYGEELFSGHDTAIRNRYFKILMPALGRKKLAYIVNHPQSYYSFYSFRTDVAKPNIASWDSLLVVFNSFPGRFKYSDEGNYLNAFLHGRLSKEKGNVIDFTTKDINKRKVTLSDYKGKKYVLLHFWATWCTPCMKEMPAIKEISDQYKLKDLQIISIALPSSKYADYLSIINKLQMNWINVYNDALQNKYGNQPTPRLCLIDKTGKLIYDSVGVEKNDIQLNELKKKLKEVITN
jgi:thiol-disulfide isomerase/thioredoxin